MPVNVITIPMLSALWQHAPKMNTEKANLTGEDRLHWLLGRMVHAHARLDLVVGLQLRWLGPYRGVNVDSLLLMTEPFIKRVRQLRPLVFDMWGHDPAARAAFEQWFDRVEHARGLRNNYAHGRWGNVGPNTPDLYYFMPLSWDFEPATMKPAERITLSQLEDQAKEIESLAQDFMRLQKLFEAEGRASKA